MLTHIQGEGASLSDIVIAKVVNLAYAKNCMSFTTSFTCLWAPPLIYPIWSVLLNEQRVTLRKIQDLELSKIQAIRAQLELEGQADLKTFSDYLVVIQNVRNNAQKEAKSIELWLEQGANPSVRLSLLCEVV